MATIFKMAAINEIFRYKLSFIWFIGLKMLHVLCNFHIN